VLDQFAGRRARFHLFGRKAVHFDVTAVAENDPARVVENDDAERQIMDGLLEQGIQARRLRLDG
jgi:hypothetical protein